MRLELLANLHWKGLRLRCQFLCPSSACLLLNPLSHISHWCFWSLLFPCWLRACLWIKPLCFINNRPVLLEIIYNKVRRTQVINIFKKFHQLNMAISYDVNNTILQSFYFDRYEDICNWYNAYLDKSSAIGQRINNVYFWEVTIGLLITYKE